jgi:hypothetical protein
MLTYADVFQMLKKATQNKEVRYAKEIAAITAKTHKSGVHATIQSRLQLLFDTGEQAATLALCSLLFDSCITAVLQLCITALYYSKSRCPLLSLAL